MGLETGFRRSGRVRLPESVREAFWVALRSGLSISQVVEKVGVSRQTLHAWLARYEAQGLEGLVDRSHRPVSCPDQMPAAVEAAVLELRRSRPYWGPRRLVFELAKRRVSPLPSESAVYRALVRLRPAGSSSSASMCAVLGGGPGLLTGRGQLPA